MPSHDQAGGDDDIVIVIPARLKSSRLPEKPLADIGGKPMVVRTYERALGVMPRDRIYVATDSEKIAGICESHGCRVVMTSPDCLTGTDRVAEFAQAVPARTYVNLQGDEPGMPGGNIQAIIDAARAYPDEVINGWAWIGSEADFVSPNVPKVVIREDGSLMYMSRAPIPGSKSREFLFGRRQVCVYAFPKAALEAFASRRKKAEHEDVEDIEILRFVEMGVGVRMLELDSNFISVDTPEDLEKARQALVS